MIPITPKLLEAFNRVRNPDYNNVVVKDSLIPAHTPVNILKFLIELGLPVSKKIAIVHVPSPYYTFDIYSPYSRHNILTSYQYFEEGTEELPVQNNIASYSVLMNILTIHFEEGYKATVGRGHDEKLVNGFIDASDHF
jgi:hypothetical protein